MAAAAPIAAKQVASVLAFERSHPYPLMGGGLGDAVPKGPGWDQTSDPIAEQTWLQHELDELIKRRSEVDAHLPTQTAIASALRIDGLRSVSSPVRALMIDADRQRRDRERELSYVDKRIKELKDKLGPLGDLL